MNTSEAVTKEAPKCDVMVVDLTDRLYPHMSDRAKAALQPSRHPGWSDDLVNVARMWDHVPTDVDLRRLGVDLTAMVEQLAAGREFTVDGLLAVPMLIPLACEACSRSTVRELLSGNTEEQLARSLSKSCTCASRRHVAMLFVRVPHSDHPTMQARLRELLPRICGLYALREGELPPSVYSDPA